jgi:menaquinone-specific isochorismate synthase
VTVLVSSLVARTQWLPEAADPLAALAPGGFAWLHDGCGFATAGVAARVAVGRGRDRLARAAAAAAAVLEAVAVDDEVGQPGTGPLVVGAVPFSDGHGGELVVPARVVGRTAEGRGWVTEVVPEGAEPAAAPPARSRPAPDPRQVVVSADGGRPAFCTAVSMALERIGAGSLQKVVLARQVAVEADIPFTVAEVVDRLRRQHPACFTFAAGGFVGASPELLARRQGLDVCSRPMAGSTRRGGDEVEDDRLVAALSSSSKDLAEHALVVDAVRAALAPVCEEVDAGSPEVVRLPTVSHLASTVRGRLRHPAPSALALAGLLHPTPAVGGLPRQAALDAIAELEDFDRGLYAGPVGWVDRRGEGEWAVALRCARLDGRTAVLAAGAGIVAGSDPEAEWAETQAKLEPMLRALVRV